MGLLHKLRNIGGKITLLPVHQTYVQPGGYNAEIEYLVFPNGKISILARYGAKKGGFSYHEALDKYRDLIQYQAELIARKLPMPEIERIVIEYDHAAEKAMVLKTSPWTGKNALDLLQELDEEKDKDQIQELVREIYKILMPVVNDRLAGWETKVGIDPRCSNFTVDEAGKMWFVDIFPPRYRRQGQPIIEWPEPKSDMGRKLGYFKHYDVRGIILCATAQLARVKPRLKYDFEAWVFEYLKTEFNEEEIKEFKTMLEDSVWRKLRNSLQGGDLPTARRLIEAADQEKICGLEYNVYALRELALEMAAMGKMEMRELDDFFRASHFEDILPVATIEALKKRLLKCLT